MDISEPGKIIVNVIAAEPLFLFGEKPLQRVEKNVVVNMKMKTTTKFEVMMNAFCRHEGLKRETLNFWFTDELQPNQTPDQLKMKNMDYVAVYHIGSPNNPLMILKKKADQTPLPLSTFSQDFKALWNNPQHCDVWLQVGKDKIPAHKTILSARCKKFCLMFQEGGMKESREFIVEIAYDNKELFLSMLEYIYTDNVELSSPTMALKLMYLADEYLLPRLQQICEEQIIKSIDVKNVASLLEDAEKYHARKLKVFCVEFIIQNYAEVSKAPEFKEYLRSPEIMHELIEALGKQLPSPCLNKKKRKKE